MGPMCVVETTLDRIVTWSQPPDAKVEYLKKKSKNVINVCCKGPSLSFSSFPPHFLPLRINEFF